MITVTQTKYKCEVSGQEFDRADDCERYETYERTRLANLKAEPPPPRPQLRIQELVGLLKAANKGAYVRYDFPMFVASGDSYRGYYNHFALGYTDMPGDALRTVQALLDHLEGVVGREYQGWKGGEFLMHANTPVWVAESGSTSGTKVVGLIVESDHEVFIETAYGTYADSDHDSDL